MRRGRGSGPRSAAQKSAAHVQRLHNMHGDIRYLSWGSDRSHRTTRLSSLCAANIIRALFPNPRVAANACVPPVFSQVAVVAEAVLEARRRLVIVAQDHMDFVLRSNTCHHTYAHPASFGAKHG